MKTPDHCDFGYVKDHRKIYQNLLKRNDLIRSPSTSQKKEDAAHKAQYQDFQSRVLTTKHTNR